MFYNILLYFAYLRPMKSPVANTRLFFGVYRETRRQKPESGYKLKVINIDIF